MTQDHVRHTIILLLSMHTNADADADQDTTTATETATDTNIDKIIYAIDARHEPVQRT